MSKPAGTENLEDILASIRKSLAEEAAGASKPRKPPAEGADAPRPGTAGEGLSSRLAGALNGAGGTRAGGGTLDGALAEFFAHVPGKDPSAPGNAKRTGGEPKDPFWFLSRSAPAADAPKAKDLAPAADPPKAKDVKLPPARTAPAEEAVRLSRPETLRPSLPPLFVAEGESAGRVRAGVPAEVPKAPAVPRGAPGAAAATSAPTDAPAVAPVTPTPAPRPQAEERTAGPARELVSPVPTEARAPAAPAAAVPEDAKQAAGQPTAPATAPATARAAAQATDPATGQASGGQGTGQATGQATGQPTGNSRNAALEEMIAQLLEPVLMRWLDNNLPRMIDQIIRAEVARAVADRS